MTLNFNFVKDMKAEDPSFLYFCCQTSAQKDQIDHETWVTFQQIWRWNACE